MSSMDEKMPVDESVFEIGDPDSDEDDLHLEVEKGEDDNKSNTELQNKQIHAVPETKTENVDEGFVTKMEDPCFNHKRENIPTVRPPKYQPILATGSDDEEEEVGKPRLRRMMGFAAHHGSRLIPAEIKDNVEHFLANTPTAAPSLYVAPPPNLWGNYGL